MIVRAGLCVIATATVAACSSSGGLAKGACGDSPSAPSGDSQGDWCFSAAEGGTLKLGNGDRLEVPPGALAQDTHLQVSTFGAADGLGRTIYLLEPSGISFETPVVLHIATEPDAVPLVYHVSAANQVLAAGSEQTVFEAVDTDDTTEDGVYSVPLEHFSIIDALFALQDPAYIVFDVPDKYIRPGDVLVTLTTIEGLLGSGGPNWQPGHVALVSDSPDPDQSRLLGHIIEATPPQVRRTTVRDLQSDVTHLHLGARRPFGVELTDVERMAVVQFAASKVESPYAMLADTAPNETEFSCISLVEQSLRTVDRGVIPWYQDAFYGTPYDLYENTEPVPVQEIAGNAIEVPMYGVRPATWLGGLHLGYYSKTEPYTLSAESLPDGATLAGDATNGYVFSWTPPVPYAVGGYYEIPITMTYDSAFEIHETLVVEVDGDFSVETFEPLSPGEGSFVGEISFPLPEGAEVRGAAVFDPETNQAIPALPFPNQAFTFEDLGDNGTGWYRVRLTLEWTVPQDQRTTVTAPPFSARAAVDYTTPRWRN